MTGRLTARSLVVSGFLAVSTLALLLSAPFAWRQWRGHSAGRKALAARSEGDRSLAAIRAQMAGLAERKSLLASKSAGNAAEMERLEKTLMPLEADASRSLKLEMLNLAAECGLVVEEIRPVEVGGRPRDPEGAVAGDSARRPATGEARAFAFLGRFPAGDAYRRPLVSLQGRARYAQVRRFFSEARGLRWQVTPVTFAIDRTRAAVAAPASFDDEEPAAAPAAPPAAPPRWLADDGLLHFTVVLAM